MRTEYQIWQDELRGREPTRFVRCIRQVPSLLAVAGCVWLLIIWIVPA